MNENRQSSPLRGGNLTFVATLTVLLATSVMGLVGSFLATYVLGSDDMKGGRSGSFFLGIVMTFYMVVALCGGTLLSSPFLAFARISRTWHCVILALATTAVSYALLFTGITIRFARLFNFHMNVVDLYEPVAATIAVQFALTAVFSLFYRASSKARMA